MHPAQPRSEKEPVFHTDSPLTYSGVNSTINLLMLVYLCGAIEYSPDHGKAWRAEITPFLHALGHEVYDPALDEEKNLNSEEVRNFRAWKTTDLPRFQQTLRKIIRYDLDWIEHRANYIIVYWDEHAGRGAGTQGELTLAHRRGIPVYFVTSMAAAQISGWILGCATEVFTSFEQLKEFLAAKYASGKKQAMSATTNN